MELIQENVSALAGKFGIDAGVLTKFLADATAAEEVKPFADSLGLFEVFTPEVLTQRISNERMDAATKAKNEATGNIYGTIDKRILEQTGVAKNQGELTVDYVARAAKEKFGTKVDETAEMTRLRGDLTAAQDLVAQTNTKLQEVEVAHATEKKQTQINGRIDTPINALSINTTPELLDSQREYLKYRLFQKYDVDLVDGKEQFTDKATKEVKRDPKTAAPMTAAALVAEFAPSVVSLKKPLATTGSQFQSSGTTQTQGAIAFDYGSYATKEAFTADMRKQGVAADSADEIKYFREFKKLRPDLFK